MLRASSLGLSFPLPTIFALHQCRRLYGVRSKLDRARNGYNAATTSLAAFQSTLPQRSEHDIDGKARDVAVIPVPQLSEEDGTTRGYPALSETVDSTRVYVPPGPTTADDVNPTDASQTAEFFALIGEELKLANINPESLSTPPWIPPVAGQTQKSRIPIKPVEISTSRHAPLTALISELRVAYQQQENPESIEVSSQTHAHISEATAGAIVDTSEAAELPTEGIDEYPMDTLPPRDTAAQIWKNLQILGTTPTSDEAWNAYVYILDVISEYPLVQEHVPQIPFSHLHRFCRVLSRARPKTHRQYLRLLSVMTYTKHCGGNLHQFEINALIDLAGKGLRKMQPETLESQLGVFTDVRAGQLPGASLYAPEEWQQPTGPAFEPDVVTLTSLITSAARGGNAITLRELVVLMNKLGLTPNRVTHIAMLAYYVNKDDFSGLRATLQRMRQLDLNLRVEGLNACMQAYSKLRKLTVVFMIYRLLRHNIVPEEYRGKNDIFEASAQLEEEFIFVEADDLPDKVTYTMVIQIMAYHGQFRAAMEVFLDMLLRTQAEPSLDPESTDAPAAQDDGDFQPTFAVYRGIFIGFCRHAVHPYEVARRQADDWTLANLREIFQRFLTLPPDLHLTQAELWIVMFAFAKASDWDLAEMREAWTAMDMRFGIRLLRPHGNSALVKLKRRLFPGAE